MKKALAFLCALAFGLPLLAAETTIDVTAANDAMSSMSTAVSGFVTTNTPVIVTLLGSALAITLVWVVWKLVRKGANKVG